VRAASVLIAHAHDLMAAGDAPLLRRTAAIATQKAVKLEKAVRHARLAEWKRSLCTSAGAPARAAFQWVKGLAGWKKSPIGSEARNDAVPDDDGEIDDIPSLEVVDRGLPADIWSPARAIDAPLCDQADIELEAEGWASLWKESETYSCQCEPLDSEPLALLLPWAVSKSSLSFPAHTGLGADNVSPRAYSRLSHVLLKKLCALLMAIELLGCWPEAVDLVLIVLLPKPDGGRRPIGLFPSVIRLWMRARSWVAKAWEAANPRPGVFGGTGMGAQRAAWESAFRGEMASFTSQAFSQSLLDLIKAFELIPHGKLVQAAAKHGYSLWVLRLSLSLRTGFAGA